MYQILELTKWAVNKLVAQPILLKLNGFYCRWAKAIPIVSYRTPGGAEAALALAASTWDGKKITSHLKNDRILVLPLLKPPLPRIVEKALILRVVVAEVNCDSLKILLKLTLTFLLLVAAVASKQMEINAHSIVELRSVAISGDLAAIRLRELFVKLI